ncbi:uncharacterized protein LOC135711617 [Ochlerotatus camptorhynchus]|uniref:uncharacterized protein LOC135711617 n=1 Tax=Ochlerotatus camptorhynchus TaxID=644619 RepID=UPI0031E1B9A6
MILKTMKANTIRNLPKTNLHHMERPLNMVNTLLKNRRIAQIIQINNTKTDHLLKMMEVVITPINTIIAVTIRNKEVMVRKGIIIIIREAQDTKDHRNLKLLSMSNNKILSAFHMDHRARVLPKNRMNLMYIKILTENLKNNVHHRDRKILDKDHKDLKTRDKDNRDKIPSALLKAQRDPKTPEKDHKDRALKTTDKDHRNTVPYVLLKDLNTMAMDHIHKAHSVRLKDHKDSTLHRILKTQDKDHKDSVLHKDLKIRNMDKIPSALLEGHKDPKTPDKNHKDSALHKTLVNNLNRDHLNRDKHSKVDQLQKW